MYEQELDSFICRLINDINTIIIHDGKLEIPIVKSLVKEGFYRGVECALADNAWHNGSFCSESLKSNTGLPDIGV